MACPCQGAGGETVLFRDLGRSCRAHGFQRLPAKHRCVRSQSATPRGGTKELPNPARPWTPIPPRETVIAGPPAASHPGTLSTPKTAPPAPPGPTAVCPAPPPARPGRRLTRRLQFRRHPRCHRLSRSRSCSCTPASSCRALRCTSPRRIGENQGSCKVSEARTRTAVSRPRPGSSFPGCSLQLGSLSFTLEGRSRHGGRTRRDR
jgi:hypothetical protein